MEWFPVWQMLILQPYNRIAIPHKFTHIHSSLTVSSQQCNPTKMDVAASHQRSSQLEFLPGTTHSTKSRNGTGCSTRPTLIHRSPAGGHASAQPCHLPYPYHSRLSSRPGSFASLFTKDGKGRSPFLLLAVLSNFHRPSQGGGSLLTTITCFIFILQQGKTQAEQADVAASPTPSLPSCDKLLLLGRKKFTLSSAEPATSSWPTIPHGSFQLAPAPQY